MFGRPSGCIDQLTTVERAAIITLHGIGWTGREIAQELHCSENTVSLWLTSWNETCGKRFDPDYMVERVPHSERVSLWGCFSARGVGQAEIFVGEFDAKRYVDILQHNLIQTAMHFYPGEYWWFQQDNAPQHTSHLAQRWFHNHGVDLLDFPPYSPDLNPIENLWSILKARVEARLARTTDEVERVLKEEWETLDKELLTSLAHSMPTRCAAVVANHGHKAPY